jgi:hypothetical protein
VGVSDHDKAAALLIEGLAKAARGLRAMTALLEQAAKMKDPA